MKQLFETGGEKPSFGTLRAPAPTGMAERIGKTVDPAIAELDKQWRARAAEFTRRRQALGPLEKPSNAPTPPPGEDVRAERFYEKYGKR
jgi:hypothetical protein